MGTGVAGVTTEDCKLPFCWWDSGCYAEGSTKRQDDNLLHICKGGAWNVLPSTPESKQRIVIESAIWGKGTSIFHVESQATTLCNSTAIATSDGEKCSIFVSNRDFGDPARNIPKLFIVVAHCELNSVTVPDSTQRFTRGEGGTAPFECPKP
jgi:hypothetical protein